MSTFAILGCGQIGSRHLQSLALLDEAAEIHLVDPSDEALRIAKERFAQAVPPAQTSAFRIVQHGSTNTLPAALDVVIVACNSMQRASLCTSLLEASNPRFIIFEKFLFPRVADFARVENLLRERQIPAYVNQWMSATESFRRIAKDFMGSPLQMLVSGRGWGLCCNAVHYIEPFQYLTGRTALRLEKTDFQEGFQDSKRAGYREIFGALTISAPDGSQLRLTCDPGPVEEAIHINLSNGRLAVAIEFYMDRFECRFEKSRQNWQATLPIPRQSQLTHLFVRDLLATGKCNLPDFTTSSAQHCLVLNAFLDHFRKYDPSIGETCPIT